jgi:hypothetical protein
MPKSPGSFRLRRWLLLAAVLAVGALVVVVVRQNREPVWEPDTKYLFRGRISGLGWVNAFVSLDGQTATVELNTDDGSFSADLTGEFLNGQLNAQELEWTGENESRAVRTLEAALTDSPLSLQGTLTEAGTGQVRAFDLQPVARYWMLRQEKGFRVLGRGWSMTVSASIPEFLEPTELDAQTTEWLREEAQVSLEQTMTNLKPGWRERMDQFRVATLLSQWESHTSWQVEFRSPKIISLRADSRDYTGGAHGNYSTMSQTWWRQEGDVLGVELRDLFREESGWETNLQAAIHRDLIRQKKQRGAESDNAYGDSQAAPPTRGLEPFTLTASGIAFYYDPYIEGSFAEGRYRVFIPLTELEPYLSTNGVMRDLRAAPARGAGR